MTTRRDFLRYAALGGASTLLPYSDGFLAALAATEVKPFQVPLRLPPVLQPTRRRGGRDYYETVMRPGRVRIIPGTRTRIWGFDGEFPGPTIEARRGREIVIRRYNKLKVPVTIHLHGGEVPASSDGHPLDVIEPGGFKDYIYPNKQPAATLWYHDHTHHHTSRNNYKGLSGLYIIRDKEEEELNLPAGKYDIPLVLQDRSFKDDGSFKFRFHHNRVRGKITLVNGRPMPYLKVANRKYRFRILNASHSSGYRLQLDSSEPFMQIGTDGGLMTQPHPVQSIPLWPSERAEVVIDFSRYPVGTKISLVSRKDPLDAETQEPVMRFDVAKEVSDNSSLPMLLRPVEPLVPGAVEREIALSFDLDRQLWVLNGKAFDPHRIDMKPRLGDVEVWTFRNNSSKAHPMHVHLGRFQVLDRSDLALEPNDLGWKDTVRVDPAANVRIAIKFERFAGRYMFHCHNLAHEDQSMMGQMRVLRPRS